MDMFFSGNLAADAEYRMVTTEKGDRPVVNFRIYVEHRVHVGDGKYEDNGGYWLSCSYWLRTESYAERLCSLLLKGKSVFVVGDLRQETWEGQSGEQSGMASQISDIGLNPIGIEDVTYLKRNEG